MGIYYETAADIVTGRASEGKFMGLASWGKAEGLHQIPVLEKKHADIEDLRKTLKMYWKDNYQMNKNYPGGGILAYANFAAQIQDDLNTKILELAKIIKEIYKRKIFFFVFQRIQTQSFSKKCRVLF